MNLQEFGQTIKQKYPQYKDIDDVELANKVLVKYPVYKSQVTIEQPTTIQKVGSTTADVGIGVSKGVLKTGTESSGLLNKIASYIPEPIRKMVFQQSITNPTLAPLAAAFKLTSQVEPTVAKIEQSKNMQPGELTTPTNTAQKVGYYGEKVGEFLTPTGLGATAKVIKKPLTLAAEKLYQSALKPRDITKAGKIVTKSEDIVKTGLKERVWLTQGGVERVANKIDDLEGQLGEVIDKAKSKGSIDVNVVRSYVDDAKGFFQNQANVPEAKKSLQEIENIGKAFRKEYGPQMSIQKAQDIKVATGQALRRYYDKMSSADIEATKQIVRGLKEQIVKKAPEAGVINTRLSSLYQFDQALTKSSTRIKNLNLLGLGTKFGAAAGGSKGAVIGLIADLMDAPSVKSGAAIGLNEIGKLGGKGAIPINTLLGLIRAKIETSQ